MRTLVRMILPNVFKKSVKNKGILRIRKGSVRIVRHVLREGGGGVSAICGSQ